MPKYDPSAAPKTIGSLHATGPYTYLTVGLPDLSTEAEIIQQAAGQAGMQLNIVTKSGVGDFVSDADKGNFNVLSLEIRIRIRTCSISCFDTIPGWWKGSELDRR